MAGSPLKLVKDKHTSSDHNKGKNTKEKVENTLTPELIIGICTPIGTLKEPVIKVFEEILKEDYGYDFQRIKLSDFLKADFKDISGRTKAYANFIGKIKEGNRLREEYKIPSILAELAIKDIYLDRASSAEDGKLPEPEDIKGKRKCYFIESLKNKEELTLLRSVYRDIFYQVSIFSPLDERKDNLSSKDLSQTEIEEIIENDEYENNTTGQNVRNTFIEADFFLRISKHNLSSLKERVKRYLNLIFESEIVTPLPEELAMYSAKSASSNSACLSRQVGAAITDSVNEIISIGWNDVPRFGGNLYKSGDKNDKRCYTYGKCFNDSTKDSLTKDVIKSIATKLKNSSLLKESINDEKLEDELFSVLRKNSKIKDLIEFSRSVHAEMHAIITGAQLAGSKMIGGKLFCTTYPCHNCARHIVVAGIKEIHYIEPYVKSLCLHLHEDSLTESESGESDKVKIIVFDGVAPRRFLEFFSMNTERKENGKLKIVNKKTINPKTRLSLQAIPTLEIQAIHSFNEIGFYEKEKQFKGIL